MRSRRPGTGYRVSHMGLWAGGWGRPGRGAGAGPGMTVEVVVARKLFAKTGSACSSLLFDISFHIILQ